MQYYLKAAECFANDVQNALCAVDREIMPMITEIRLRRNKPLMLCSAKETAFLSAAGRLTPVPAPDSLIITERMLQENFLKLCDYSVYSSMAELKNGFITVAGGSRVGVCASAVLREGQVVSVKNVTSLNFRIARAVRGCALPILNTLFVHALPSVILAGPPGSGKTTVLRDLALQLSNGFAGRYIKVCIADERGEFAANGSRFELETGLNCDVYSYFPKRDAIEMAMRTMSAQLIVCDEVATPSDVDAIAHGFSSGIAFAVSVHLNSIEDVFSKLAVRRLLEFNEFSYLILLKNYANDFVMIDCKEVYNEIHRRDSSHNGSNGHGPLFF